MKLLMKSSRCPTGVFPLESVVKGYQSGHNAEAQERGDTAIGWVQIKNGIGWAGNQPSPERGRHHDEARHPVLRRPRVRRRRPLVAVACTALIALLLLSSTGCATQEDRDRAAVAKQIPNEFVPALSSSKEIGALTDLRDLENPGGELLEFFDNHSSVPRVIEAEPDRALLAVWRTAQAGAEPFNANRSATASACVELQRTTEGLQAEIVDCPGSLTEYAPRAEPAYGAVSWARNAEAVAQTSYAAAALGLEIRWLVFENEDGTQPRTEERSARSVENALDKRAKTLGNHVLRIHVETTDFAQDDEMVTGTLVVTAEVPDPTDAAGTVTATCRYAMEAVLAITSSEGNENWSPIRQTWC